MPGATVLHVLAITAGKTLSAEVLYKEIQRGKRGGTYSISYAIHSSPGSELARDSVTVSHATYQAMKPGDSFEVLVSPVLPSFAHWTSIAAQSGWTKLGGLWLMVLFWNGVLSVFVYSLYLVPLRQRRLVSRGQPTLGEVTSSQTVHVGRGRLQREVRYAYRAQGSDGVDQLIESRARIDPSGNEPRVGDTLTVLYDPRRPRRSVPYLGSGVQALPADGEATAASVSER